MCEKACMPPPGKFSWYQDEGFSVTVYRIPILCSEGQEGFWLFYTRKV